jgi:hypothetical protein
MDVRIRSMPGCAPRGSGTGRAIKSGSVELQAAALRSPVLLEEKSQAKTGSENAQTRIRVLCLPGI